MPPISAIETAGQTHHAEAYETVRFTIDKAEVTLFGLPEGGDVTISIPQIRTVSMTIPPHREIMIFERDPDSPDVIDNLAFTITTP